MPSKRPRTAVGEDRLPAQSRTPIQCLIGDFDVSVGDECLVSRAVAGVHEVLVKGRVDTRLPIETLPAPCDDQVDERQHAVLHELVRRVLVFSVGVADVFLKKPAVRFPIAGGRGGCVVTDVGGEQCGQPLLDAGSGFEVAEAVDVEAIVGDRLCEHPLLLMCHTQVFQRHRMVAGVGLFEQPCIDLNRAFVVAFDGLLFGLGQQRLHPLGG